MRLFAAPSLAARRLAAGFLALLIAAFAAVPDARAAEIVSPEPDAAARTFVVSLKRCAAGSGRLAIGVLGFPRSFTGLSDAERVEVRRLVEALLARQPGIVLKPVADLDKLLAGRLNAGGHDAADIAAIFEKARDVTALVHFEGRRSAGEFALTLVATTRSGDCLAAGGLAPLRLALDAGPRLADLRKLVETEFARAVKNDPGVAEVVVETFRPDGATPYSRCNEAVTGLVLDELSRLNADPDLALRQRRLTIRRAVPGTAPAPEAAVLSGSFGSDAAGVWVTADLAMADGRVLAKTYRTHVTGLDCEPRALDFLEGLRADAIADPTRLEVTAERPTVAVGGFLAFRIRLGPDPATLYCWALAADRTAFVVLPAPGAEAGARMKAGASAIFPDDFGFPPIVASEPSENVFGCFAARTALSPAATAAWAAKYGPVGRAADGALDESEIDTLLATMRSEPGIVESYGAVRIVP